MVKLGQVVSGATAFIEAKIFPSLNLTSRMTATAALAYARIKPINALTFGAMLLMPKATPDSVINTAKALELVDNEYNIDINTLIEMGKETARKQDKIKIPFFGCDVFMEESHFDLLKTFIEKAE